MDSKALASAIKEQEWLGTAADKTSSIVAAAFEKSGDAGTAIKDFLHGVWLGHPLHPVITDVPLGAWTAAMVLDALDSMSKDDGYSKGADTAVAVGLVGAVGAAITGLTDWHVYGEDKPKRVGMAHALLNTAAATLFAGSLVLRKRNKRAAGKTMSTLGYGMAIAGAYLGGNLVYEEKLGVYHGQTDLPEKWTPVMEESELENNKPALADLKGEPIVLVRKDGEIYALGEKCSHFGGPLSEGDIEGNCIRCPWHGSLFSMEDGSIAEGPATFPQPALEARVRKGKIEVRRKRE